MSTPVGSTIELEAIGKRYGDTVALDHVDLTVPPGSLTTIVGPSGCGKSTLLRILAGLEEATGGELRIDGRPVRTGQNRDVAMVFQDYALYPHMTVEANLSFGLRMQARHDRRNGPTKREIAERVTSAAEMLGLENLLGRKPRQLSGGQRQRVALARAIVRRPPVLLLDEPLSALDAQLRSSARAEILRLHRELGSTLVLVTHDQHEALSMATDLIVMQDGRVAQSGSPAEVFRTPATEFVAAFVGTPSMNLFRDADGTVGWRGTDARLLAPGQDPAGTMVIGTVQYCEFTGDGQTVVCLGDHGPFTFVQRDADAGELVRPGEMVRLAVPKDRVHRFGPNGARR